MITKEQAITLVSRNMANRNGFNLERLTELKQYSWGGYCKQNLLMIILFYMDILIVI
jgi:hypothetical protein